MTDYLTGIEVLAIHADQIERYGGAEGLRMPDCWKLPCFARRPAITPT